jgi:UDP-N-acetylglucosamine 2-epimerase
MLATSGEKMRRLYINSGVGPERVDATGIAHFDSLFSRNAERDKQALLERGIELDKKLVIFATDVLLMDEAERMLTGVIDTVLKNRDASLVVKVHPREEAGPFQTIVDRYPGANIKVFRDIDLYALLNNCELLITKGSTVALEAMMIGKAVIILDLSDKPVAVPYVKEGAALGVYRQEDVEDAIFKMLYDEESRGRLKVKRDEFVRNWAHEPDGRASERIVTLMKDLIGKKKG